MKRMMVVVLWAVVFPVMVFAEEAAPAAPPAVVSGQRTPFLFNLGVRLLGADVGLGYRGLSAPEGPDTILWLIVGGGYEWLNYFRDPANRLYAGGGGFDPAEDPFYTRVNGRLDLGIAQGFIYHDRLKGNLLEAFAFYKMRVDYVLNDPAKDELILASGLPDAAGLFQNSLLVGLSYNDLDKTDPHRTQKGVSAEVSAEWGPSFLFNSAYGRADFFRLNLTARGFLPVFDIDPAAEFNSFSGYAGGFFAVDWSTGEDIPINVQQSFGGRSPRQGLGYAVRGYEDARFDGLFKAVLNLEFRVNLPQFKIIDVITPGVVAFFDSGYFNYLYYHEDGFLFSSGIGLFVDVWKFTTFTLYTVIDFSRPQMNGQYWVPVLFAFDAHF
jgi:hypothetical protein